MLKLHTEGVVKLLVPDIKLDQYIFLRLFMIYFGIHFSFFYFFFFTFWHCKMLVSNINFKTRSVNSFEIVHALSLPLFIFHLFCFLASWSVGIIYKTRPLDLFEIVHDIFCLHYFVSGDSSISLSFSANPSHSIWKPQICSRLLFSSLISV